MDARVRDVLITGFEDLVPSLELPAPGDRHVLAAIRAEADIIVTANLKDFPAASLATPRATARRRRYRVFRPVAAWPQESARQPPRRLT